MIQTLTRPDVVIKHMSARTSYTVPYCGSSFTTRSTSAASFGEQQQELQAMPGSSPDLAGYSGEVGNG